MSEEVKSEQSYIARASGLKGKDYVSYALGDTGCCLAFGLVTTILQRYYTDVLLLNPLFIMLMFVAARIWDAVNDPIMGRICDTMKVSKWGRYRPWFLYGGIPLAIASVLMFVVGPNSVTEPGSVGLSVFATITYVFFGMSYTVIQIPYGTLASVVTLDDKERSKLSIWRSVGAALGSIPVMVIGMIAFKPDGVDYKLMMIGVVAMGTTSLIMLILAFFGNKERVHTEPQKPEKGATVKAFKKLFKSKSMVTVSIAAMLLFAGQIFNQSFYSYLINIYFNEGGIWTMMPTVLTYLPMAFLMFFTPSLVRKFGKKEVSATGMAVAAGANLLMFFLLFMGPTNAALYLFMLLCLVSGIGLNFFVLQVWAMAADSIDEIEVKTGSREDGTAYSFFMFFRKMGQVIAAVAVNATLLAMGYYETVSAGSFVFSEGQLTTMFILATIIPAVFFGIMAVLLFFIFPLSKKKVAVLQDEKEAHLRKLAEGDEEGIVTEAEVIDAEAQPVEDKAE